MFGATPNMHAAYNMGDYKMAGDYKSAGGIGHSNHTNSTQTASHHPNGINATNNNGNHSMGTTSPSSTSLQSAATAAAAAAAAAASKPTDHHGSGASSGSYASYFGQLAATSAMDNVMCRPVHWESMNLMWHQTFSNKKILNIAMAMAIITDQLLLGCLIINIYLSWFIYWEVEQCFIGQIC